MSISRAVLVQAIRALSSVDDVVMNPAALVEDAMLLTLAFDQEEPYKTAVANTVKAFKDLSRGKVSPSALSGVYNGWMSYHYQPKVAQGASASMRIVFKRGEGSLYVLGFGHRSTPSDIYRRLSALRLG